MWAISVPNIATCPRQWWRPNSITNDVPRPQSIRTWIKHIPQLLSTFWVQQQLSDYKHEITLQSNADSIAALFHQVTKSSQMSPGCRVPNGFPPFTLVSLSTERNVTSIRHWLVSSTTLPPRCICACLYTGPFSMKWKFSIAEFSYD